MEAFDLDRMAEYESLSGQLRTRGPLTEVLEADAAKLNHISRSWNVDLDILKRFRKLHRQHFSGYMGEKREAMVRKYQYDVKNASHLIRLLRMGSEFLQTGKLQVYRGADADELKHIKRGGWTLDRVKREAETLFTQVEASRARSPLPPTPDHAAANELLIQLHTDVLGLDGRR